MHFKLVVAFFCGLFALQAHAQSIAQELSALPKADVEVKKIAVAARAVSDPNLQLKIFGVDLGSRGIVPVQIAIKNKSENRVVVNPNASFSVSLTNGKELMPTAVWAVAPQYSPDQNGALPLRLEQDCPRLLTSIAGPHITTCSKSFGIKLNPVPTNRVYAVAFPRSYVNPGEEKSGVIFFTIPKTEAPLNGLEVKFNFIDAQDNVYLGQLHFRELVPLSYSALK